jgi:hypothetical protein
MSLEMTLEADVHLNRSDIDDALETMDASRIELGDRSPWAYFPNSGMNLYLHERMPPRPPRDDAKDIADWPVGLDLTFRYFTPKFDECQKDLKLFVEHLAKISDAFFVVAFQREEIYAIRDEAGLRFFSSWQDDRQAD